MMNIDAVFVVVAVLLGVLVWRRWSRKAAIAILLLSLTLVALAQFSLDLGLAVALVGVPIVWRQSHKTRVVCAAILLVCQLVLLGPDFVTSLRPVNGMACQQEDDQTSYRQAYWEGVHAMHNYLAKAVIHPAVLYVIALAILVVVPYRKKEPQQSPSGDSLKVPIMKTSRGFRIALLVVLLVPALFCLWVCLRLPSDFFLVNREMWDVLRECWMENDKHGRYPQDLNELGIRHRYDKWGHQYVFVPYDQETRFGLLISWGADGKPGGWGRNRDRIAAFGDRFN